MGTVAADVHHQARESDPATPFSPGARLRKPIRSDPAGEAAGRRKRLLQIPQPGRNSVPADATNSTDFSSMTLSDLASPEAGLSKAGNSFTIWRHARRKRYATDATHKLPRTWAQIAIIPRNNDSEAKAAASSTTARNITTPLLAFRASAQPDGQSPKNVKRT